MITPYCKTCNQNDDPTPLIMFPASILLLIQNNPIKPENKVMMSWLMLLEIVSETARSRLPSSMYKTLPKYSPIRLGVLTENETPDNIALKDLEKLTG